MSMRIRTTSRHIRATLATLLLLAGLLVLAGCGSMPEAVSGSGPPPTQAFVPPSEGTRIEPPREVADFALPGDEGEEISLLEDLQGKPVLLYFGYTFCPDICPTSLADMVRTKRQLGEQAEDVHFVMISVDPERDTPQVMDRYLSNFDEDFIGLTGDATTLRRIAPDYGLYYQKREIEGTSAAYLIDHSTAIYLLDAEGRLHTIYGYGTPADVMTEDIQAMLAEEDAS